eukprot:13376911-Alexandrium_andersonii.AAC.1
MISRAHRMGNHRSDLIADRGRELHGWGHMCAHLCKQRARYVQFVANVQSMMLSILLATLDIMKDPLRRARGRGFAIASG